MGFSRDLETVPEIIDELNELAGIYKAVLERETNPKIAYVELLESHNMASLSKAGLWMPADFFRDIFMPFWADRETQSYESWRQIAAVGSLLWLWLIANESKLDQSDIIFLKDQKMRLFFLIPGLLDDHQISPYVKNPNFPVQITFDESKFAYRCLMQSLLDDSDDEKTTSLQ